MIVVARLIKLEQVFSTYSRVLRQAEIIACSSDLKGAAKHKNCHEFQCCGNSRKKTPY